MMMTLTKGVTILYIFSFIVYQEILCAPGKKDARFTNAPTAMEPRSIGAAEDIISLPGVASIISRPPPGHIYFEGPDNENGGTETLGTRGVDDDAKRNGNVNVIDKQALKEKVIEKAQEFILNGNNQKTLSKTSDTLISILQDKTSAETLIEILTTVKEGAVDPKVLKSVRYLQGKLNKFLMGDESPENVKRHMQVLENYYQNPQRVDIIRRETKLSEMFLSSPHLVDAMNVVKQQIATLVNNKNMEERLVSLFNQLRLLLGLGPTNSSFKKSS